MEQRRDARQISPLKDEVWMEGWWHDCGLMMMLVLVGLRYILVLSVPSSWRVIWTSRNAIEPFSSSSLVNFTLGWISLRISLNCSKGSL